MVAQIITWVFATVLAIFMPRYLGAVNIGKLHLANSIWGIMTVVIGFGTEILLTKEIARTPAKTGELVGTSNVVRTILFIISLGMVAIYTNLAGYAQDTALIIYVLGISILIYQIAGSFQAALQGLERMEYFSLSDVLSKGVMAVVTIALLVMGYGVLEVALIGILGGLIAWGVQYYAVRRYQPLAFRFNWSKAVWMLKAGFPYLLVSGFLIIYSQLDVIFLSLILNEESIGWYGTANRLFGTLLFVPTVFITAVFPALSRLYSEGSNHLAKLMQKSFDLLFLLSVPIGLGIFVIAPQIVVLLYGSEFANSGPILAYLGIVLIFIYQNILIGRYLISVDRQNTWTIIMAIAMIVTIPLDLILVPWCETRFGNGALGGALSYILTEGGMLVAGILLMPRGTLGRQNAWLAMRVVLAGIVMAVVVWLVREQFILIPIGIGGITYLGMILILRVIPKEDWALLRTILQSVLARFRKPQPEVPV